VVKTKGEKMKKHLKTLLVALIIVPCLVMMTACGGGSVKIPGGTYKLAGAEIGGVQFSLDDFMAYYDANDEEEAAEYVQETFQSIINAILPQWKTKVQQVLTAINGLTGPELEEAFEEFDFIYGNEAKFLAIGAMTNPTERAEAIEELAKELAGMQVGLTLFVVIFMIIMEMELTIDAKNITVAMKGLGEETDVFYIPSSSETFEYTTNSKGAITVKGDGTENPVDDLGENGFIKYKNGEIIMGAIDETGISFALIFKTVAEEAEEEPAA